ncbi:MAG: hypothetical protein LBQ54_03550 [Planctomycetaceae bacterium]|jgi:hypothetical protein|nr:hypothetical protein [Planctomycetaceae bacterium]
MRKWFFTVLSMMLACSLHAQDEPKKITVRELFVPASEMAKLLENCKDRVLLPREEFETLLLESLQQRETQDSPDAAAPVATVFLASDYTVTIEGEQAKIHAVLQWESLTDKRQALPLDLDSVAVQSAILDGEPARFGVSPHEEETPAPYAPYTLFLRGKGRHTLELEMTSQLLVDTVRQEIRFRVPRAPKTAERLVVPGDVELKDGAVIVSRHVEGEGASRVTKFELLPQSDAQHLTLTLNSHRTQILKSVLSQSVQFAEVTGHYEKLHAAFSLDILHQPVQTAEFVVPRGFEMTGAVSPQLAKWSVTERENQSILEVRFREPVSGIVSVNLTAVHFFDTVSANDTLSEWAFPAFKPLEVSSDSAVFGLLLETQWNVHKLDATRLIAIAPEILQNTISAEVFETTADAPAVRTVAAWYAPNTGDWSIVCEFLKPKPAFDAVSHQVLTLSDKEQTLRGLLQISPRHEKLFTLKLEVPENWTVTRVTDQEDVMIPFEQKGTSVQIKVVNGIEPQTVFPVFFEAKGDTPGWFGDWSEQKFPFPRFCLADAADDRGTIAVTVDSDMLVTSENDVRLIPLDNKERTEFLAGLPVDMAFRYWSQPYSTELCITRTLPRLTARTFAFFRFAPSLMSVNYELHYNVEQARTKFLSFLLPAETPEHIGIFGLNGLEVKEYVSTPVTAADGREFRKWNVQLAGPQSGLLTLGVRFEQTTEAETTQELPLVTAEETAWQSGLVSVEGHEELNLSLHETAVPSQTASPSLLRPVDVGELAASHYIPGQRLLGVYEGITRENPLHVDIKQNPDFQLPSSLVQLVYGEVEIAANGKRVTKAVYDLKTRATFLMIDLNGNEEIWAVSLDGAVIKPQKDGNGIMADIPAKPDSIVRRLEIVWAAAESSGASPVFASSDIRLPDLLVPKKAGEHDFRYLAPEATTLVCAEAGTIIWQKVPVTRVVWNVTAPPGYEVVRIGDKPLENEPPRPLVMRYLHNIFLSPFMSARESARYAADLPQSKRKIKMSAETEWNSDSEILLEESEESLGKKDGRFITEDSNSEDAKKLQNFNRSSEETSDRRSYRSGINDSEVSSAVPQAVPNEPLQTVPYQNKTLQTVQPVQVRFQQNLASPLQRHKQFQMIGGSEMQLRVRTVNTQLFTFGFYFIWGSVLLAGLFLWKASVRTRMIFVLSVMSGGTLLVLVPRFDVFASLFDEAVKAGFWVFAVYLFTGVWQKMKQRKTQNISAAVMMFLTLTWISGPVHAETSEEKPIRIPDDVIVAFYDAETMLAAPQLEDGLPHPKLLTRTDQKLLVPYAKYMELWNLVHPEKKAAAEEKAPADYAVLSGEYRAVLGQTEDLSITGDAEIEILNNKPILFPLALGQGILTGLKVDDRDAEISVTPSKNGLFAVQIHGKGKHRIVFTVKFKAERQGGWRLVSGRLAKFPAEKVLVTLPEEQMELRCSNVAAQQKWLAAKPNETIATALAPNGEFRWSWRSKVTGAEIDQSLTADSELRFNIREDALLLDWDLSLAFRRGKHESFQLRVPKKSLVVSVKGENVRGWENVETDSQTDTMIEVELLHPTEGNDQFHLVLRSDADFSDVKQQTITVPNVGVAGAAMHHGRITIQHSPRLEVKIGETSNLSMTDMPDRQNDKEETPAGDSLVKEMVKTSVAENPFGLTPFRALRFTSENYQLPLTVTQKDLTVVRTAENIVKLSPHLVRLECSHLFRSERPEWTLFHEDLILPKDFRLETVQSESPVEWSTKPLESGETELTVLWANVPGKRNIRFNIIGTVACDAEKEVDVPIIRDKTGQTERFRMVQQQFAVLADPSFDVDIHDTHLVYIREPEQMSGWIANEYRPLRRQEFSLSGRDGKPSAKLTLVPRMPKITCESITNVRTNSRSIEEMILLDYNIQNAGIHSVQFELPKEMADARIDAPLLQRKEITDTDHGTILVTLHLQDEIMNEFRVLIRNDRELISGKPYFAAIPKMLTGNVLNRYIVLENAGSFDEMQVDTKNLAGVRKISRQQKEWGRLREILGAGAAEAYLVSHAADGEKEVPPKLAFSMMRRETVKMSGAQIGLAETRAVLGENGDYTAEQIYRIDNKTEQYLDLKLPAGAEIRVVRILSTPEWNLRESGRSGDFGQPVKPTLFSARDIPVRNLSDKSGVSFVRIPIVKTEVGDLDYIVRIVYAGKMRKIRWVSSLDVPFLEVLNIPVSSSYVKLYLPDNYRFRFDGTMRKTDSAVVAETRSEYENQLNTKLQETLQAGNPYEKVRAFSNIRQLGGLSKDLSSFKSSPVQAQGRESPQTDGTSMSNSPQMDNFSRTSPAAQQQQFHSNSLQLQQRFESQENARGRNVVIQSEDGKKTDSSSSTRSSDLNLKSGSVFGKEKAPQSSLKDQEKLSDQKLASKLSVQKQSSESSSLVPLPQSQQMPQSSLEQENLERYAQKQAAQNALVPNPQWSMTIPQQQIPQQQIPRQSSSLSPEQTLQSPQGSFMQGYYAPPSSLPQVPQSVYAQGQIVPQDGIVSNERNVPAMTPSPSQPQSGPGIAIAAGIGRTSRSGSAEVQQSDEAARVSSGILLDSMAGKSPELGLGLGYELGRQDSSLFGAAGGISGGNLSMSGSFQPPVAVNGDLWESERLPLNNELVPAQSAPVDTVSPSMTAVTATKSASLDIEIPQIGTVYFFTAPLSEKRLSVSGISLVAEKRLSDLAFSVCLSGVIAFVWFYAARRQSRHRRT